MNDTENNKSWVKIVGKRTMLIPTLELVKARAEAADQTINVLQLRQMLADEYGTDATCPVTIRRHLQALGYPVRKGTDRIKPGPWRPGPPQPRRRAQIESADR